jgi:hypothetical protein
MTSALPALGVWRVPSAAVASLPGRAMAAIASSSVAISRRTS